MHKNIIISIIRDNENTIKKLNNKDYTEQMMIEDILEQNEQLEALLLTTN